MKNKTLWWEDRWIANAYSWCPSYSGSSIPYLFTYSIHTYHLSKLELHLAEFRGKARYPDQVSIICTTNSLRLAGKLELTSGKMCCTHWAGCQSLIGLIRWQTTIHTHIHIYSQFRVASLQVFGLGWNLNTQRKPMQACRGHARAAQKGPVRG